MAKAATIFDRLAREFEVAWYELVLDRDPSNLIAIDQLAHAYTDLGRYTEGLTMDRRLVEAMPETPIVHYNLACSLSLTDQLDEAIDALLRAIDLGYDEFDHMMEDEDLEAVRSSERFEEVIEAAEAFDPDEDDDSEDDDDLDREEDF